MGNSNSVVINRGSTVIYGDNVVIVNGKVIKGIERKLNHNEDTESASLEIVVPKDSQLEYELTSNVGLIDVSGVKASKFKVQTSAGDVELTDIDSESIYLETMSGDIELNRIKADDIALESMSGDIDAVINDYKNNFFIEKCTMSGDINIDSYDGYSDSIQNRNKKLYIKTMSGDVDILFKKR